MHSFYKTASLYERTVHTMLGILAVLAVTYCAVLLSIVFSVIERKQDTLAIRDTSSVLTSLEAKYANTVASIDEAVLLENNFVRINSTTFAVRKDAIASYSVLYAR